MLQTLKSRPLSEADSDQAQFISAGDLFALVRRFIYRQYPVIVIGAFLTVALAVSYLVVTPSRFTATAKMIIDPGTVQRFQERSVPGETTMNASTVESEVELLRSDNISLAVIKDLRLTEDPEFINPPRSPHRAVLAFVSRLFAWLLPSDAPKAGGEDDRRFRLERQANGVFQEALTVKRVGLSYVMEISFQSLDPERAAQITNALAEAYIVDQLQSKYDAARRAGAWLQDRIRELREQATTAEQAVVDFKSKHNIVAASGRLMTEQQLSEVNTQLVSARAQAAEAKARLERIDEIVRTGNREAAVVRDAAVSDSLRNEVITKLRQQYLELSAREADWSVRYGRNHLAAVNLRNQMQEIRRSIYDELGRIAETYKSDYEIAKSREESLEKSLESVIAQSQTTNQAQLGLRDLEAAAQTYRTMHDSFLQRYMESVQQQSFPITQARVISPAVRPLSKSHPKTLLIVAASIVGGGILGVGFALLRDLADRAFRTSGQVESVLHLKCLAIVPSIKAASKKRTLRPALGSRDADARGTSTSERGRDLNSYAVEAPLSRFAESIRAIKVASGVNGLIKGTKVLAVTSTTPDEGKSTISANLAQLMAHAGARTILIDGDIRNPSLTRVFAPTAQFGLLDVVAGRVALEHALWTDPSTGMLFLPTVTSGPIAHASEILESDSTKALFERLRQRYEHVIVDLPPLTPIVDVRSTTHLIDAYLFVIEWGKSKTDAVSQALDEVESIYDKVLGVVLNKADMRMIDRYDGRRGNYGYSRYDGRYGLS